ncbi:MAG: hypothetical protein ACR2I0_04035, partial [Rhodoferax sp.]
YDQLSVSGTATLAGTLSLEFINDFRPVVGQVFDIIKWSQRSGSFSSYTGLYAGNGIFLKPVYQADRLQLVATALPGLDSLSIAGVPEAQAALDQVLTGVANASACSAVAFDASLVLAGVRLAGSWEVAVAPLNSGVETTFTAKNVAAEWSGAGLSGALSGVSGSLVLSGSQSTLSLSGLGQVVLPSGDALAGNFVLSGDSASGLLNVAASNVAAHIGDPARGAALGLSNASLVMSLGANGYALRATGDGVLQGAPGSSFSGTLGYVANSFGRAVNVTFSQGGVSHSLQIASAERVSRFEAIGASLTVDGLGTLHGDFAFTAHNTQSATARVQELLVGVRNLSATLSLGDLSMAASQGWLGLVLSTTTSLDGLGAASTALALAGEVDASVKVDSLLTLSGSRIRIAINPQASAVAREVLSTGDTLLLDLAAGTLQIAGRFSASISGVMAFAGDLVLDVAHTTRLLSTGKTVQLTEYALSGSGVTATLSAAGTGMDVTTSGAEVAIVYAKDVASSRSWLTSRGATQALSVAGYLIDQIDSAQWSLNRAVDAVAVAEASTIDWSTTRSFTLASGRKFLLDQVGEVITLPVKGAISIGANSVSGALELTYNRSADYWSVKASDAQVLLAAGPAFVRLTNGSGTLRLNADRSRSGTIAGDFDLGGIAGLGLSGTGTASFGADGELALSGTAVAAVDGFGSLSGSFGVARQDTASGTRILIGASDVSAQVGSSAANLSIAHATLGLVLGSDALGAGGYALVASGSATLNGFTGTASLS